MKEKRASQAQSEEKQVATQEKNVRRSQKAILRAAFPSFIEQIASGKPVKDCLASLNLHWPTLQRALESHPDWRVKYDRARKDCAEYWVAEIVPMSDAVIGEEMNVVTATRNAVDARKWIAGKLAPREYGEVPTGVTINNQTNVMVVSDDRLRALQALRQKMLNSSTSTPLSPEREA